jgi:hypothetical protein
MAPVEIRRDIPQAERDAMDPEDFAGKGRSFPINKPEDVAAAAASLGRAGDDNFSTDTLKDNIIRIAKRKGPAFVAQLPKAWRDEVGEETDGGGETAGRAYPQPVSAQARAYARVAEMRADPLMARTMAALRGRRLWAGGTARTRRSTRRPPRARRRGCWTARSRRLSRRRSPSWPPAATARRSTGAGRSRAWPPSR